jgi:hypothetical protein
VRAVQIIGSSSIITRAPEGSLDALLADPKLKSLNKSIQINHDWDNRVARDMQAAYQQFQAGNNAQFQANLRKGREDNARLLANGKAFQDNMRASTDHALATDRAQQNAIDASSLGYDPNGQVYPVSQSWTELVPK